MSMTSKNPTVRSAQIHGSSLCALFIVRRRCCTNDSTVDKIAYCDIFWRCVLENFSFCLKLKVLEFPDRNYTACFRCQFNRIHWEILGHVFQPLQAEGIRWAPILTLGATSYKSIPGSSSGVLQDVSSSKRCILNHYDAKRKDTCLSMRRSYQNLGLTVSCWSSGWDAEFPLLLLTSGNVEKRCH